MIWKPRSSWLRAQPPRPLGACRCGGPARLRAQKWIVCTKINEIIENILTKEILSKNGIIIIHRHKKDTTVLTDKINIFESRTYGISKIFFGY